MERAISPLLTCNLVIAAIPVISQQQDLQTAALGSPTTLSCDTFGSPQPQITWIKKDGDLPMYVTFIYASLCLLCLLI